MKAKNFVLGLAIAIATAFSIKCMYFDVQNHNLEQQINESKKYTQLCDTIISEASVTDEFADGIGETDAYDMWLRHNHKY